MRERVSALPVPSVNPAHGVAAAGVQALAVRRHNAPASILQRPRGRARAIAREEPVRRPSLRGMLALYLAVLRQDGLTAVVHPRPVIGASDGVQASCHAEQYNCGTSQRLTSSYPA